MSKALVIKGANFIANKVETITITEVVPCTGISLSDSTHAFTAIGATKTLTATVTPADTTESVVWASSNTDCATVANGVVTCVGVGSATITASCGEYSATCAITSTVTIDANTELTAVNGYAQSGADIANSKDYIGPYATSKARVYLSPDVTPTGYKAISGTNDTPWDALYPIMIPKGTSKIAFTAPSGLQNHVTATLLNSTMHPTYKIALKGCKAVTDNTDTKANNYELDLSGYSGYDSFVFNCQTTGADASTITGDVTVTFI